MADLDITIGTPTLKVGEVFRVRYRKLPNGSFVSIADQTNAQFTVTGLDAGSQYLFEFTHILADDTECQTSYRTYTIPNPFSCAGRNFSVDLIQDTNGLFYIQLTFIAGTNPPCGWEIEYTQNGQATQIIPYATLPVNGLIKIPVNNIGGDIIVRALLCNGQSTICYESDFEAVIPPPCVPIVITDYSLDRNPPYIQPIFTLRIVFTQSTPATRNGMVVFQQTGIPLPGQPPLDSGVWTGLTIAGGNGQANQVISGTATPTETIGGAFFYHVVLIDDCGVRHEFDVVGE